MKNFFKILMALSFLNFANAVELVPFDAEYTADFKQGISIGGGAVRKLTKNNNGSFNLFFRASMIAASMEEKGAFMVKNDKVFPLTYGYKRSALGKNRDTKQIFHWNTMQAENIDYKGSINIKLQNGVLDRSSYQIALQLDVANGKKNMSYKVLDGRNIETYNFKVIGNETIKTPVGSLRVVKVERVRNANSKRETALWFALDWDYLLVRLVQVETDGKSYQVDLKKGKVDGITVEGQ